MLLNTEMQLSVADWLDPKFELSLLKALRQKQSK